MTKRQLFEEFCRRLCDLLGPESREARLRLCREFKRKLGEVA
jgi:hypothetical protein